jgi:hypothetical protein
MTAKHRAAVEALKAWAIEANQNDPAGLALACQALDAAFGDNDAEAQAFFTMWRDPHVRWRVSCLMTPCERFQAPHYCPLD